MNNVEFVKSLYAAFTRGDLETIFAACDPNIEWVSNSDPALIPWGGERKGIDGARSFFKELTAHIEYESFQPRDFIGGSDYVTVLGHTIARVNPSGGRVDGEWIHLFKFKTERWSRSGTMATPMPWCRPISAATFIPSLWRPRRRRRGSSTKVTSSQSSKTPASTSVAGVSVRLVPREEAQLGFDVRRRFRTSVPGHSSRNRRTRRSRV